LRLRARFAHPGKGHRPCHSATQILGPPGAKAPGQYPPRPQRALRPRRVGRWPLVVRVAPVLGLRPARAGKRGSRFLIPPGGAKALSPLQWQGPLPLPQRHAAPCPAGGQSPRPAPDPPTAGASRPPGRALACGVPGPAGLQGTVPRGRGNALRFLIRPEWRKHFHRFHGRGHRPCHSATLPLDQLGAKAPGHRPTRHRRALACGVPGPAGLQGTVPRGRGNAGRVS
jgi:hypothetical protein